MVCEIEHVGEFVQSCDIETSFQHFEAYSVNLKGVYKQSGEIDVANEIEAAQSFLDSCDDKEHVLSKVLDASPVNSVDMFPPPQKGLKVTEQLGADQGPKMGRVFRPWEEFVTGFRGGTILWEIGIWKSMILLKESNFIWKVAWLGLLTVGAPKKNHQ
ncbi:OLC1v1013312C1 [Oldenlandia corymbosa var. corymbosa]|uniref:OLC1v1013312C1 n=1 Tax=Oldenlandia corymbosa var. corymbosa TaxID=529605 RepID=A0AAV1DYR4_OLDCO|nr:OLC1v1013312C1 [Oldenlandia corymbosa var. corymbosa]